MPFDGVCRRSHERQSRVQRLPSDDQTVNIDALSPGNWLIRGFGRTAPVVGIPTVSTTGLLVMGLLVFAAAVGTLRRRAVAT